MSTKPRIKMPDQAKAGDVVEIKTLVAHVMETGNRKDAAGKTIPRNIINAFTATLGGKEVFSAKLQSGTSSNPYIAFFVKAPAATSEMEFTWIDDAGVTITDKQPLKVG
jgi:sulfur-oxidizing protein SoxZ